MLKKLFVVVMVLLLSIFAVACSDEAASKEDDNDTEKQEANKEKEAADKKEQEAAKKEKSAVPSDEELTAVLDENVQTLMDKDLEGHMKTIHSESPAYDQTEKTIEMLEPYEIDIILDDVSVEDKSEAMAKIAYTQTAMKVSGPTYQNNKIVGVHTLKPEDGKWKIYNSEVQETIPLDENGKEIKQSANPNVTVEGEFAPIMKKLEINLEQEKWTVSAYTEAAGEASLEFLPKGETAQNYTELFSVQFYKDGNKKAGTKAWIKSMKQNLNKIITGDLKFKVINQSATEGTYFFAVANDEKQADQQEIARVFVEGNDLFVARYTVMEQKMDKATKSKWQDKLSKVKLN